ncbi:peptidoglycan-binding domain-containing protein [Zhihengliuella sp.]|uniref:peptidoglycan-binding domain-containing protein n=1 Tax=Zhihengliuella sp. TaxID=1954483 RepID=UPI002810CB33|nr:peptidoglycan-binding domain-containing protein [Zhihengliuella sp.]
MSIYNGYVGAKSCTKGPTTGARGVLAWLLAKYADDGALNAGIYNCRPVRGGRTTSLHGEGRAVDLAIRPYSAQYGTDLADLIRRHSAELGIQCVIWNRKIWSGYYNVWRDYDGLNPHVDHLHIELSWPAAHRSADDTVDLWERVLGDLVDDDDGPAFVPAGQVAKPAQGSAAVAAAPTDYPELVVDGDFGPVSVRAFQILMHAIDQYEHAVDGVFGRMTVRAMQRWLAGLGLYDRAIDGRLGEYTVLGLQEFLKSKGLYRGLLDGQFGPLTIKGLQAYLNTQNDY